MGGKRLLAGGGAFRCVGAICGSDVISVPANDASLAQNPCNSYWLYPLWIDIVSLRVFLRRP